MYVYKLQKCQLFYVTTATEMKSLPDYPNVAQWHKDDPDFGE